MKMLKCVCFSAVILHNIFSGLCHPILKDLGNEKILLETIKPIVLNSNKTETLEKYEKVNNEAIFFKNENVPTNVSVKSHEQDEQSLISNKFDELETEKEIQDARQFDTVDKDSSRTNRSGNLLEQDNGQVKEQKSNLLDEKEDENKKAECEALCSSCNGSESVFDVAEPSCFCKVTLVQSVQCLEEKVTDDYPMKVIAFVVTAPRSHEESLVAEYLKTKKELSLNRRRRESRDKRCCGQVAAANPRLSLKKDIEPHEEKKSNEYPQQNLEPETKEGKDQEVDSTLRQPNRKRQSSLQSRKQKQYDQEENKISEGKQTGGVDNHDEMLGARKITAESVLDNLFRKALRAEDTSLERTEEETEDNMRKKKTTKQKKVVNIPDDNYKLLGSRKSTSSKKKENLNDVVSEDGQEALKAKQKFRYSEKKQSTTEKDKENLVTDESTQKKNRAISVNNKKEDKTNQETLQNEKYTEELKLPKQKLKKTSQEFDDFLYEQELKRQKILSSIREKYAPVSEPTKISDMKSDKEKDSEITKTKRKKYPQSDTDILGSKYIEKSETTKSSKLNKENKNTDDNKNRKTDSGKDFSWPNQENGKYRINKILKEIKDDNIRALETLKKPAEEKRKLQGGINAEENFKTIVSPYIDNKINKNQEPSKSFADQYREISPKKEYLDKENELGGNGRTKETLGTLIAKIRAKYDKNVENTNDSKIINKKVLNSSTDRKPSFLREKFISKYDFPKDQLKNDEKTRTSSSKDILSPVDEKLNLESGIHQEKFNSEMLGKPNKYIKSKYSGVKPILIRDEEEESNIKKKDEKERKSSKYQIKKQINKAKHVEEDKEEVAGKIEPTMVKSKKSIQTKYLRKSAEKEQVDSKMNSAQEVPNEKSFSDATLGKEKQKLDSLLKGSSIQPTNEKLKVSLEEQRQLLEERLKAVPRKQYYPKEDIAEERVHNLDTNHESSLVDNDYEPENEQAKKLSLREQIEQIKAKRLEFIETKSHETNPYDNSKLSSTQDRLPRLSLKQFIEQKQNSLKGKKVEKEAHFKGESSNNEETIIVGAPLDSKAKSLQDLIGQNPQEDCERCQKYMDQISQKQKEQILGQKPHITRSISPALLNQKVGFVETEGEVAKEKFLNCKCYEQTKEAHSGPVLGQPNPNVKREMLGQPFNMQDVSKKFEEIKTKIESGVKGANDRVSKEFSDLNTNIKNQYEQVSHSDFAKKLKDSTDKVSRGLSDMVHGVQDTYLSSSHKEIESRPKDTSNMDVAHSVDSGFNHLASGMVSPSTPNIYLYSPNPQQVIPEDQMQNPYIQGKYVNNPNQQFQPQIQKSGNARAPVSLA